MNDHRIVGIHVTNRATAAGRVQEILSKYGRNIRTRLGLHDVHEEGVSPSALILIEAVGGHQQIDALSDELRRLPGIQVQSMFFSHPCDGNPGRVPKLSRDGTRPAKPAGSPRDPE